MTSFDDFVTDADLPDLDWNAQADADAERLAHIQDEYAAQYWDVAALDDGSHADRLAPSQEEGGDA
ncbi:MAG: hypothetical protein BWY76_00014 [bacterium ADurb.Bin429]|nr:MAG: hypothetical protein BWY76_00014 [bacterium ADurb.Bin429]